MISFVLFPQASQPFMNFNISELAYFASPLPLCYIELPLHPFYDNNNNYFIIKSIIVIIIIIIK